MNALRPIIVGLVLAAAVAAPLLVEQRAAIGLSRREDSMRRQTEWLAQATAEQQRLSALVAGLPPPLAGAEVTELLRLRNEVGQLRQSLKEMDRLENESGRIRGAVKALENGTDAEIPNALLVEEMDLRRARLAQLDQWLAHLPEERIPELRFLSEDEWIKSAEAQRVTDEEYRLWMSKQRDWASMKFAPLAQRALKAYAQVHDGQFPTEVSQLQPFFASPVEDVILERYAVVPAKSLIDDLAKVDENWVITPKAPVNEQHDLRIGVGLNGRVNSLAAGRWSAPR
jgi:hypothetical protein